MTRIVCDMPGCSEKAAYDAKTTMGPWAYLCKRHEKTVGTGIEAYTTKLKKEPNPECNLRPGVPKEILWLEDEWD